MWVTRNGNGRRGWDGGRYVREVRDPSGGTTGRVFQRDWKGDVECGGCHQEGGLGECSGMVKHSRSPPVGRNVRGSRRVSCRRLPCTSPVLVVPDRGSPDETGRTGLRTLLGRSGLPFPPDLTVLGSGSPVEGVRLTFVDNRKTSRFI